MSFSKGDEVLAEAGALATTRYGESWFELGNAITGVYEGEWILENDPERRGYEIRVGGVWFCVKPPHKIRRYTRLERKMDEIQNR